jgi:hypothetical protein
VKPAAWAGTALLVLGCKGIFGDSARIIALELVGPTSDTVQAGDTLHLHARALSAAGDTVAGAVVEWAVLDTGAVRITLDPATGTVVPDSVGTWHLQARVEEIRSDPVTLYVRPAPAAALRVTGLPATVAAQTAHDVTVTAIDAFGNQATSYTGSVHFASSDPAATLPADFTYPAAAAGAHTFPNGVTLRTPGSQSVTAADLATPAITGTQSAITVMPAPAGSETRRP